MSYSYSDFCRLNYLTPSRPTTFLFKITGVKFIDIKKIKIDWLWEAIILGKFVDPVCVELTAILPTTEYTRP